MKNDPYSPPPPAGRGPGPLPASWLPFVGWIALGLGLVLKILGAALDLPSGYGIEDFLGFTDAEAIAAARGLWGPVPGAGDGSGRHAYAVAYLGLDLAFFIPAYALAALRIAGWLDRHLGPVPPASRAFVMRHGVARFAALATAVLVPVDLVETTVGLVKLDEPLWGLGACAAGVALTVLGLRSLHMDPRGRRWLGAAAAGAFALSAAALAGADALGCGGGTALREWGCLAHRAKQVPVLALIGALLLGLLWWLTGFRAPPAERPARSELRVAVGEIVVRSRYVLVLLVLLTALLFLGGQSRDVLVGMLADPTRDHPALTWVAIAVSLVALWTLSHSCWLWARVACRVPGPGRRRGGDAPDGAGERGPNPYVEVFARHWSRALGVAPLLVFASLAAMTLHDLVVARARDGEGKMLVAALAGLLLGALFIIGREAAGVRQDRHARAGVLPPERYFDDPGVVESGRVRLTDRHWEGPRYRFWFVFERAPVWLPLASLGAMVACRLPGSLDLPGWPPLAFANMLFAFSAWIGFFGWLGLVERRHAVPWVTLLLGAAGLLGFWQLTDNHVVWTFEQHRGADSPATMWLATAALAAVMGAFAWWAVTRAPERSGRARLVGVGVLVAVAGLVMVAADRLLSGRIDRVSGPRAALPGAPSDAAPGLDDALARWLTGLRRRESAAGAGSPEEAPVPVYFVAAEGGGARAAYWTAQVLQALSASGKPEYKDFPERTFAISSVSGGSIGAAAFVACRRLHGRDAAAAGACLETLGRTDLVSPLLGALLFEDVVARVVPTSACATPACGVLSRGVWFERVLQRGVPALKDGLRGSRPGPQAAASGAAALASAPAHLPYLFLNSTWVESGERAIASEVRITQEDFPTARDTLAILGHDLTLATAAHNSARFPFVNAIGAVHTTRGRCTRAAGAPQADREVACGHVADGGYFDNSGSHTVIDLLHGLRALLAGRAQPGPAADAPDWEATRAWALRRLDPRVLFIHNGVALACERPKRLHQPGAEQVRCRGKPAGFEPQAPAAGASLRLYADLLGIAQTAVNVTGLGSNRRRADALLVDEIRQLHFQLADARRRAAGDAAGPGATRRTETARCIDQLNNGVLYPLGWYLSAAARKGMDDQVPDALDAPGCRLYADDAPAGGAAAAQRMPE